MARAMKKAPKGIKGRPCQLEGQLIDSNSIR